MRASARRVRSLVLRQPFDRLLVSHWPLADDTVRREIRDDGDAPPVLALVDVGEMNFDDRRVEQLERVTDRVAVVGPRAGIDDDTVGPIERLVDPVDELALVIRLFALRARVLVACPLVDL